ncbi:EamA-like transporter family protein [Candidatus Planktophila sulfonica]|uniref:EamA-like transporter family protein n=1 Tax=Candidatus Planktophila sulfonica TaxID=1884904 RepID=A0A249KFM1_9ACTN|nr:DMT family transporter [Candidatus Planktophila sulfonica]ASY15598.1 EamA-like transporter family protein [Candidatus Planktophila sulfonica]
MAASLTKTQRSGLFFAFLGIFAFSLSLPFTKLALKSFDPLFTAFARPVIAASLAIPLMIIAKVPKLPRELWRPTAFTALGAVFGWPILIALALQRTTSAHVSVIAAVMPLVTAIIAVIKHRKHPGISFWVASSLGTVLLIAFSITRGGTSDSDLFTDLLIIGAVIASSYCYVEGASLTSYMPGWQVISWVVVVSMPIAIPASAIVYAQTNTSYDFHGDALFGLLAIGFSSMYLGFFAWYRGLRDFGVAHGSQVQQLQAIMTLGWSALLLGESVTLTMVLSAIGIVLCVLWALSNVNKR